jgi:hypothetical protein
MDMGIGIDGVDGAKESNSENALLAWATARIDQLVNEKSAGEHLCELIDWIAYFTREHFGFQQRLLKECSQHREYLLNRVAVHCEFRRNLSRLCIDMMRGDPTVLERLRSLCHELQQDAQAHDQGIFEIVRNGGASPKLRKKRRRGQLAVEAARLFECHIPVSAGEAATLSRVGT